MSDLPSRLNAALQGRYRIERLLGEGGMATVYLAEDLRHDRKVAIKVLKPELSAVIGAERFLAEIKTTANLQHPHILPLFDSGEADGFLFYVMPFIDGESLRERIDREKQLPVEEAVRVAAAVGSALDYAHRQGVVHRDIKPANILLHDGEPLVADFGIALAVSQAGGGRLTETGLSLGTPHYMSPEQATADRTPGPQSDIYALGCVAYEMLTGAPPFAAPTAQAVLMQILTEDPKPVTAIRRSVPPHVEAAVERALEKLPADRFRTAGEFGKALQDPGAAGAPRRSATAVKGTGPERGLRRWAWPLVACVATVAAVAAWTRGGSGGGEEVIRLAVPVADEVEMNGAMALSPDGRSLAYLGTVRGTTAAVFLQPLSSFEPRLVAELFGVVLAFSPDGSQLVFHNNATLYVSDVSGGGARPLAEGVAQFSPVLWGRDGWLYFSRRDGDAARVREDGSGLEPVETRGEGTLFIMDEVEAGRAVIARSNTGYSLTSRIGILDLDSGEFSPLVEGDNARLLAGRYLVWSDGPTLYAQRFDARARALAGPREMILQDLAISFAGAVLWDVSESGTLVYQALQPATPNLIEISRQGLRSALGRLVESDLGFRLSPDGARLVYEDRRTGTSDVYTLDLASGTKERLTFQANGFYPAWTPDGSRVAYYRVVDGEYGLYWQLADGSGVEEVLLDAPGPEVEVEFIPPAGDSILVRTGDVSRQDGTDIHLFAAGDPGSGRPVAAGPGNERSPRVSPDGRFVAYVSDELGAEHIFVRSIADPRQRWQISDGEGGIEPNWSPDGSEIFYRTPANLMTVPVRLSPGFRRAGEATPLFSLLNTAENSNHTFYEVLPDGEGFLFLEAPPPADLRIVLNWVEELRERLGR